MLVESLLGTPSTIQREEESWRDQFAFNPTLDEIAVNLLPWCALMHRELLELYNYDSVQSDQLLPLFVWKNKVTNKGTKQRLIMNSACVLIPMDRHVNPAYMYMKPLPYNRQKQLLESVKDGVLLPKTSHQDLNHVLSDDEYKTCNLKTTSASIKYNQIKPCKTQIPDVLQTPESNHDKTPGSGNGQLKHIMNQLIENPHF